MVLDPLIVEEEVRRACGAAQSGECRAAYLAELHWDMNISMAWENVKVRNRNVVENLTCERVSI